MKINIPREVHDKIMYWVKKSTDEVSGFGTVEVEGSDIHVLDAWLLPQKVGSAHTDIDADGLAAMQYKHIKERMNGELKFWWHSHVKMDVFWSGTDKATIKELGGNGWIVASVFNQREESRSAFCGLVEVPVIGKAVHFLDELPLSITNYYSHEATLQWDKDFDECVKTYRYTPTVLTEGAEVNDSLYEQWKKSEQKVKKQKGYANASDDVKLKAEAKLLGISPKEYQDIIDGKADWITQVQLEEKVFELERKGMVPHGLFY